MFDLYETKPRTARVVQLTHENCYAVAEWLLEHGHRALMERYGEPPYGSWIVVFEEPGAAQVYTNDEFLEGFRKEWQQA